MAYFCCRYPLEFGREFGKLMYWNSPLAAKTRYAHVNGGADPRNTFFATILLLTDTCHSSFPAWTALCQKRNTTVSANPKNPEQILSGGGAGAWVGHHLFGAVHLTHGRNNLVFQLFRSITAYYLQKWLAELENHKTCVSTVPVSNDTPQLATWSSQYERKLYKRNIKYIYTGGPNQGWTQNV